MRTQNIDYWLNNEQRTEKGKRVPVSDSEYSYQEISEFYLLNREKEQLKKIA